MRFHILVFACFALLATGCAPNTPSITPALAPTALPVPIGNHPLYVVDTNNGELVTRVLLVDADAERVTMTLTTRYTPEISLSPDGCVTCDGGRLYVADSYRTRVTSGGNHDVITVYDAATGTVLKDEVEIPGRLLYKVFPNAHPYTFISGDGKYLLVGQYGAPDVHSLRLAIYDAKSLTLLAEVKHPCGGQALLPLRDGRVLCSPTLFFDPATHESASLGLSLPAVSTPVLSGDESKLFLVSSDAREGPNVSVVSLGGTPEIDADRVPLRLAPGARVSLLHAALSPDGTRLYVGAITGRHDYNGVPDDIVAFETTTWEDAGTFRPRDPPFHFAVSVDGTQLYAVSPIAGTLAIFDTSTFRERALMRVGNTPAHVVVPRSR